MGDFFRAVKPMSINALEAAADQTRKLLGIEPTARVQMIKLLEIVLEEVLHDYLFEVMPAEEMPGMDGKTAIGHFNICLADHTYRSLYNGDPEARLVAAHEFGHLMLHSHQQPSLAWRSSSDDMVDPEWQADRFAEFWLMPRAGVVRCISAAEVAEKFTVPLEAAERRFAEIRPTWAEKIQGELF